MMAMTFFLFLPITLVLMVVAFKSGLRNRILGCVWVCKLEEKLVIGRCAYWALFVLIIAAGVFTRCWQFLELPQGYNQDGLMAAVEAYCLSQGGVDQLGTSWPTYFEAWGFAQMSVLYSWIMIPFIRILGLSKLALRLPMLLISLAMMPVIWDFARRMLGKGFALLALFVVAINPWHILQSRWALEANVLPHLLLLACYLLYIGMKHRSALYASMLLFGLTPYAYGLACFSVPVILLCMAVYYAVHKKANILDILICVIIFLGISGPFFYTMAINTFGLEPAMIGPVTMPLFEQSQRTMDMPFTKLNPYASVLGNFVDFLYGTVLGSAESSYSSINWAHTIYRFMPPIFLYAVYRMWKCRRELAVRGEDSFRCHGMIIVLVWLLAALVNGLLIGGVVNRNNVAFYPMILVCAYGLYIMGKRLRVAATLMLVMLTISFVGLNVTYFADEEYQESISVGVFRNGLVEALEDTWDWDYDEVYIGVGNTITSCKVAEASAMFAHHIDYAGRSEQTDLLNAAGEPTGWYFTERYQLVNMEEFEPDPMACSVYIFEQGWKNKFVEEEYLIRDYGHYCAVYPRYWAE